MNDIQDIEELYKRESEEREGLSIIFDAVKDGNVQAPILTLLSAATLINLGLSTGPVDVLISQSKGGFAQACAYRALHVIGSYNQRLALLFNAGAQIVDPQQSQPEYQTNIEDMIKREIVSSVQLIPQLCTHMDTHTGLAGKLFAQGVTEQQSLQDFAQTYRQIKPNIDGTLNKYWPDALYEEWSITELINPELDARQNYLANTQDLAKAHLLFAGAEHNYAKICLTQMQLAGTHQDKKTFRQRLDEIRNCFNIASVHLGLEENDTTSLARLSATPAPRGARHYIDAAKAYRV